MSGVAAALPELPGSEVKVVMEGKEFYTLMPFTAFAISRIITNEIQITFLTAKPAVFQPGMYFEGIVSYRSLYDESLKIGF